jgi:hypothetical protein
MTSLRRVLAASLAGLAAACSPTFNWREASLPGGPGHAMFPCRPSHEQRTVPLAGRPVAMTVLSCRTGETMFALGVADVGDPTQVGAALEALKSAAAANIGAMPVRAGAAELAGATPNEQAGTYRMLGRLPDGRAVQARLMVFTQGTRVFQATVFAERLPTDAADTFFGGLSLR